LYFKNDAVRRDTITDKRDKAKRNELKKSLMPNACCLKYFNVSTFLILGLVKKNVELV
jgi:hypothetical protein